MTFEKFCDAVSVATRQHTNWRAGQTAFNTLYDILPEMADEIRGGACDPFYRDDKLPDFYAIVAIRWSLYA